MVPSHLAEPVSTSGDGLSCVREGWVGDQGKVLHPEGELFLPREWSWPEVVRAPGGFGLRDAQGRTVGVSV